MNRNDGGPAFPVECYFNDDGTPRIGVQTGNATGMATGLSVRDYFAAKAMTSVMASPAWEHRTTPEQISETAYAMADAMLAWGAK